MTIFNEYYPIMIPSVLCGALCWAIYIFPSYNTFTWWNVFLCIIDIDIVVFFYNDYLTCLFFIWLYLIFILYCVANFMQYIFLVLKETANCCRYFIPMNCVWYFYWTFFLIPYNIMFNVYLKCWLFILLYCNYIFIIWCLSAVVGLLKVTVASI